MNTVLRYLWRRRTTLVGYLGATLSILAVADDVFSPITLKYMLLGSTLLTALIGHHNNLRMRRSGTAD
jgi:hypothetical protein